MAEAEGKLTGRPGIAFVTRGPGASNAAIGIHTAAQDSTPMIVFVGQVGGDFVDREAFQEIDYRRMYGSVAKWAAQIDRAERIPEYVARAFRVAMSGRPGPVVLALPEDMLTARAECARRAARGAGRRGARRGAGRGGARAARGAAAAAGARRRQPLGRRRLRGAARASPKRTSSRSPARSATRTCSTTAIANYAGDVGVGVNPTLAARIRDADVLLVIGERLGEITTSGYTLVEAPTPKQTPDPRASRAPTSSAASTSRRWRSPRRPARSSPR